MFYNESFYKCRDISQGNSSQRGLNGIWVVWKYSLYFLTVLVGELWGFPKLSQLYIKSTEFPRDLNYEAQQVELLLLFFLHISATYILLFTMHNLYHKICSPILVRMNITTQLLKNGSQLQYIFRMVATSKLNNTNPTVFVNKDSTTALKMPIRNFQLMGSVHQWTTEIWNSYSSYSKPIPISDF